MAAERRRRQRRMLQTVAAMPSEVRAAWWCCGGGRGRGGGAGRTLTKSRIESGAGGDFGGGITVSSAGGWREGPPWAQAAGRPLPAAAVRVSVGERAAATGDGSGSVRPARLAAEVLVLVPRAVRAAAVAPVRRPVRTARRRLGLWLGLCRRLRRLRFGLRLVDLRRFRQLRLRLDDRIGGLRRLDGQFCLGRLAAARRADRWMPRPVRPAVLAAASGQQRAAAWLTSALGGGVSCGGFGSSIVTSMARSSMSRR